MLYLLRGPSGSGKTTLANTLLLAGVVDHVFEADQFMIDEDGTYKYDRSRLQYCHDQCERATREALAQGKNVAVANTMTKCWEVAKYYEMSDDVTIITLEGQFPNVHDVPSDIVEMQRKRLERWSIKDRAQNKGKKMVKV
ncbi:AAA family ATPase [Tateyamaria sp. Alg231-49]|uniref:AAA family ATPase n=1 Tax=Tateyamaria sp. Alg231-49 TaxID=1922219 RepID=UPI000D560EDC|nr:AAA family ATPase [Tateyamaria sp. Alg231-49]